MDGDNVVWKFAKNDDVVEKCCEKCQRCREGMCDDLPACLGFTVPHDDDRRCFPHFESFEDLGGDSSLESQTCTNGCGYYEGALSREVSISCFQLEVCLTSVLIIVFKPLTVYGKKIRHLNRFRLT